MTNAPKKICKNCGAQAPSRFCSECGQPTNITVPTLSGLMHDFLAVAFSYDSRLFNTLRVLVCEPGGLSKAYVEGVRARYLSPIQLFVWLEAIAFFFNRYLFDQSPDVSSQKSRDLLLIGVGVAVYMSLINALKRRRVIESVVFVSHLWSFLMFVLMGVYLILPLVEFIRTKVAPGTTFRIGIAATEAALACMLVYAPMALMKMYRDRLWAALLKTAGMFGFAVMVDYVLQILLHRGHKL